MGTVGVLISRTLAFEPVGGQITESVTHGQTYDYLPCRRESAPLGCYQIILHGEQLAQSCYVAVRWPGVELMISQSRVQCPNHYTTEPLIISLYVHMFLSVFVVIRRHHEAAVK